MRTTLLALLVLFAGAPARSAPPETAVDASHLLYQESLHNLRVPLTRLTRWDPRARDFKADGTDPAPRAKLVVVHLFASWCQQCKDELPAFRDLTTRLKEEYQDEVRVLFVDIPGDPGLRSFLAEQPKAFPAGSLYFDQDGRLVRSLPPGFRLPLTLLLDRAPAEWGGGAVRQAFVGVLRRGTLVNAIARLWRCLTPDQPGT